MEGKEVDNERELARNSTNVSINYHIKQRIEDALGKKCKQTIQCYFHYMKLPALSPCLNKP